MKIGELAHRAGCTVETVRFYEREGLLPEVGRTASNYRVYEEKHLERLQFIRNCRALDMTHEEIRSLLGVVDRPDGRCGAVEALVRTHIGHVDARITELQRLRTQLAQLVDLCVEELPVGDCALVRGLAALEPDQRPERHTHLG